MRIGWLSLALAGLATTACVEWNRATGAADASTDVGLTTDRTAVADAPGAELTCSRSGAVDLLLMIDNSNSMRDNQVNLARNLAAMIPVLTQSGGLRSLHLGVISHDLGTPGSVVPSCANSDVGDDGILNPIRYGAAIRTHQPWTTAPPMVRPTRCENRADQYPSFLTYDPFRDDPNVFRDDAICNAFLSVGGCGLEQQIESTYRALVVDRARNPPSNQGFLRDDSVLAVLLLTDEEDGSVRDCRYAEFGDPDGSCRSGGAGDATSVFDTNNPNWSSADLNLRVYMYTPGSPQDPTWPMSRYVDPRRPDRGFFSVMQGRRSLLVMGAIAGVPIELPRIADRVDWERLLGRRADGSDGFVGMSNEGPVSMRQRNMDPMCTTRVVPSCRREGTVYDPTACDTTRQYFAWPSRRVAELIRRVEAANGNAMLESICRNDYSPAIRSFAELIRRRLCP